jgi:hypothetical protein
MASTDNHDAISHETGLTLAGTYALERILAVPEAADELVTGRVGVAVGDAGPGAGS